MKKTMRILTALIVFLSVLSISNAVDYGFTYRYFEMAEERATLLGGKVHKIFNGIGLGAGLYLSSTVEAPTDDLIRYDEINLSYIGGSIFKPYPIFPSLTLVPSLFYGQGSVNADRKFTGSDDLLLEESSSINVLEPGISLIASLTNLIQIEASYSYTSIYGTDLENLDDDDFGGFTVGFSIIINADNTDDYSTSDGVTSPAWGRTPGSGN